MTNDTGWLPIETAPKDGTKILLFFPRHTTELGVEPDMVEVGYWIPPQKCKHCGGHLSEHQGLWAGEDWDAKATLWMPILMPLDELAKLGQEMGDYD